MAEHERETSGGWDGGRGGALGTQARPARRLRPEVAADWAAKSRAGRLEELYRKPVAELSPTDLSLMKAAFFRG